MDVSPYVARKRIDLISRKGAVRMRPGTGIVFAQRVPRKPGEEQDEATFAVIGGPTVLRIGAVPRTPERSQRAHRLALAPSGLAQLPNRGAPPPRAVVRKPKSQPKEEGKRQKLRR